MRTEPGAVNIQATEEGGSPRPWRTEGQAERTRNGNRASDNNQQQEATQPIRELPRDRRRTMVLPEDFRLPCQVQKVRGGVPRRMRFIPVSQTETEAYGNDPYAGCSKAHALMYLNSRHWNENKDKRNLLVSASAGLGPGRQKVLQSRRYNRVVFFADCLNGGKVCCKILETQPESVQFFTNMMHGGYGVGWIYVFEEPEPVTNYLGGTQSIPLLQHATRVYPVECDYAKVLPPVPLKRPDAGETKYFVYHNFKELVVGKTEVENSSCGGRFCDRQVSAGGTPGAIVPCGCFHRKDKYRLIARHLLRIPCEGNVNETGRVMVVNFRSLRFDELLFRQGSQRVFDTIELGDDIVISVLRTRVCKLVKHVNRHHGWTIVGWARTGKVRDANEEGNRDADDVAAEEVSPHVTYLYPTDPDDVDADKMEDYRALLITEDAFSKEIKEKREQQKQEEENGTTSSKRKR